MVGGARRTALGFRRPPRPVRRAEPALVPARTRGDTRLPTSPVPTTVSTVTRPALAGAPGRQPETPRRPLRRRGRLLVHTGPCPGHGDPEPARFGSARSLPLAGKRSRRSGTASWHSRPWPCPGSAQAAGWELTGLCPACFRGTMRAGERPDHGQQLSPGTSRPLGGVTVTQGGAPGIEIKGHTQRPGPTQASRPSAPEGPHAVTPHCHTASLCRRLLLRALRRGQSGTTAPGWLRQGWG